jgi:hypothetical protein
MKMRLLILSFLLSGLFMSAQSKDELLQTIKEKENIISFQSKKINELESTIGKLGKDTLKCSSEREELRHLLRISTNRWLKPVFISRYLENNFYQKTSLANPKDDFTEIQKVYNQYDLISNSLRMTAISEDTVRSAQRALDFNENFLNLFKIRRDVLSVKPDSVIIKKALIKLDSLPELEKDSKLQEDKDLIQALILNYKKRSCELKRDLAGFLRADQTAAQKAYNDFKKDPRYSPYPYLIGVIEEIQKDINLYTDDDLPCFDKKEDHAGENENSKEVQEKTDKITSPDPQTETLSKESVGSLPEEKESKNKPKEDASDGAPNDVKNL